MSETITVQNEALVVVGIDNIEIRKWKLELPAKQGRLIVPEGHALIRIRATGICGSDIHYWKDGSAATIKDTKDPFVIGHECAGEIVTLGANAGKWTVGNRVAIKPAKPCLRCDDCTTGFSNLCGNVDHFGIPGTDGSCSTMKVVALDQLVQLPSKMSWTEAGVVQPLAVSIQMSRQAGDFRHKTVLITGGGCIGLLLGAIAKAYGASKVVVLEIQPNRADFARSYCADQAFVNPPYEAGESTDGYSRRVSKHILDNVRDLKRGFDICIEASGAEECMNVCIRASRPGGTYVQVGVYGGNHPQIPIIEIVSKQITLKGTYRYTTNCFEQAIELIDRGLVDVASLVSHTYNFKDGLEAFEAVHKSADKSGKKAMKCVILHDGGDSTAGGL